jgi:hypothetical protein
MPQGHMPGAVNMREIFTFLATSTAEGLQDLKSTFAQHFGAVAWAGRRPPCSTKTRSTAATARAAAATTC